MHKKTICGNCKYKTVSVKKNPCNKCAHCIGTKALSSYFIKKVSKKKIFDIKPVIKDKVIVEKKSELMQKQCFSCIDYHYYQRYGYCLGCANHSKYIPEPCIPKIKPETDAYGHGIPKEFLDFGAMVIIEDGDNNPANGIITERLTSKNGIMAIHLEGQDETRLFSLKNITKIMLITEKKVFSVTKKGNKNNGN